MTIMVSSINGNYMYNENINISSFLRGLFVFSSPNKHNIQFYLEIIIMDKYPFVIAVFVIFLKNGDKFSKI